jgi:POT family proton-dependent oligopeptide transporter
MTAVDHVSPSGTHGDAGPLTGAGRWRPPWRGQPRALVSLAGVELWERFSFYGLQVLLAYYLYHSLAEGGLGLSKQFAVGIAGTYGGLVYVAQLVGGWLADRVIAPRTLVLISAVLIMLGHIALALVPRLTGVELGLVLIVVGTGGLKVNVTAMVGMLYPGSGALRDAGYSLYYMGISVGAFLGPLLSGFLQNSAGFHVAFGAAAVGMAAGLVQYLLGYKHLPDVTKTVANPIPPSRRVVAVSAAMALAAVVVIAFRVHVMTLDNLGTVLTGIVIVCSIAYFTLMLTSQRISAGERTGVLTYLPIFLSTLLFWTLLFQLFTTLAVYMDTRVNLHLGPVTIPAAVVITIEGVFASVLAPLYASLWERLGSRQPSHGVKIFIGICLLGAAFAILSAMGRSNGAVNPVAVLLVVVFLFGAAEIAVVPSALSATAELAPKAFKVQVMALYFLTMAGGSTLAGLTAQHYDPSAELTFFGTIAATAILIAAVLLAAYRILARRLS